MTLALVLSDAIYDDPADKTPTPPGTLRYFPIGPGGRARKLFTDEKYVEAAETLRPSVEQGGVTTGDWNQDGFPDLVVANLGVNRLLINNDDGTFRAEATDETDDSTLLTTSIAIADITGDSLPALEAKIQQKNEVVADLPFGFGKKAINPSIGIAEIPIHPFSFHNLE